MTEHVLKCFADSVPNSCAGREGVFYKAQVSSWNSIS